MDSNNIIKKMYHSKLFERLFHTTVYLLKSNLVGCSSVLDIGCGPCSPIQYCQDIRFSIGVETYKPYIEISKERKIHTKYVCGNILNMKFPKKSFDAVVMIEVLEHLNKKEGMRLLKRADGWARKRVIVGTPNDFVPQGEIDNNIKQKHLSGWTGREMKALGYKVHGLSGFKFLRENSHKESMRDNITESIRFEPKVVWFIVAAISQIITYWFPEQAFEIFCTKDEE